MAVRHEAAVLQQEPRRRRRAATRLDAEPAAWQEFGAGVLALRRPWNWDGARSRAIRASACRAAVAFAREAVAVRPDLGLPRLSGSYRGAVSLTWDAPQESLTVFVRTADLGRVEYHWETLAYDYGGGTGTRQDVLERLIRL